MSSDWPAEAMLACVRASPEAVAAHDKAAWLGLFADDAEVHDPVGSRGHRGHSAISRFYDTFIAPNDIHFEVLAEGACDDVVFRDVVIHTRMGTGLAVAVPAHIRYRLTTADDGALRVRRLDAHWELRRMVGQSLRAGPRGWITHARLSTHMLACQGLGGVLGFMRGFRGVGTRGTHVATRFLHAIRAGARGDAAALLTADAVLREPGRQDVALDRLCASVGNLQWHKLIAAGRHVTASLERDGTPGLALFTLDRRRIERLRFHF